MSDVRRDTLALDDAAFAELYDKRIAPGLAAREAERQAALAAYERWSKWVIWGAVGVGFLAAVVTDNFVVGVIAGIFAFFGARTYLLSPLTSIAMSAHSDALAAVAEATGCSYKPDGFTPDAYKELRGFGLLPSSTRTRFRDRFVGTHKRCEFTFCKAWLERSKRNQGPLFEGHLISIALRKKFTGTTVLHRDSGDLGNWVAQRLEWNMKRYDLGDADLEKAFEAYTTDDFEASVIVDSAFLKRLLEVEQRFAGRSLRCALTKGTLLIAVESSVSEVRAERDQLFKRLMTYESYRKEGISVDAKKVAEIDGALDEESAPTELTMDGRLDSLTRARAIATEVTEIMGLIDTILARA